MHDNYKSLSFSMRDNHKSLAAKSFASGVEEKPTVVKIGGMWVCTLPQRKAEMFIEYDDAIDHALSDEVQLAYRVAREGNK